MFSIADNACAKKELHQEEPQEKADESSEPSSSCDKSSKGNDFSSDEAKESEGDSDPVTDHNNKQEDQVTNKNDGSDQVIDNKPVIVKFSCDICNISVNSATQLSQVSYFKITFNLDFGITVG